MTDLVFIECRGPIEGKRFLNGDTVAGTLTLVEKPFDFSGTRWERREVEPGVFVFKCLGDLQGRGRFLNGITEKGLVDLAPNAEKFSGTRWRAENRDGGTILECKGHLTSRPERFLNGDTRPEGGGVNLAPNTSPPFTGTVWRLSPSAPSPS
ncbi:hypothetical protein RKD18_001300 [Streptomyces phaeoluteigriseus]